MASTEPPREDAAQALLRDLESRGGSRWRRRLVIALLLGGAAFGAYTWRARSKPEAPPRFTTHKLETRDIVEDVQSTGKVKPLKEVQIGAQVSGRIVTVSVDFNSQVTKGQVLAEIDPRVFGAQVSQTRAQIDSARALVKKAEATLAIAETTLGRVQRLQKENVATQAELDQALGNRDVAKAEVAGSEANLAQLQAQLASASTTLQYTKIMSPIDGVVITRSIDPGQTVAASFSAPVLFVIAPDLTRMQVLAEVDEADVGKVKEGMKAEVVVDAFPGQTFHGTVTQIRFSPNEVQGVVTYSAVIDVANPDMLLRPGMTATVTIQTRRATAVLAVPNAALRFRPVKIEPGQPAGKAPEPVFAAELKPGQARVYVPAPGKKDQAEEKIVEVGLSDGRSTELKSGLGPGAEVITEQRDAKRPEKFMGLF